MKKKFLNVVLSMTIVTSMMFSVTACGSKQDIATWVTSDEAVEFTDAMNASLDGMSLKLEADGNTLAMIITFDDVIELAEGVEENMEQAFESQAATFEALRDQLVKSTGNKDAKVRVSYVNGDGTEIYSKEF